MLLSLNLLYFLLFAKVIRLWEIHRRFTTDLMTILLLLLNHYQKL
jgi:hypothetical protein